MVGSTAKSTYLNKITVSIFQNFLYILTVNYVINFVFSIGKQPYRDVINFVSYIHVVYSYNNINFTYLYIRTNYLRHLDNIVGVGLFGGGGGRGQLPNAKKCNFAVADKHDAVLEVIDGQALL